MDQNARLLTPEEAADFLQVTRRRMLQLPIKQTRLGDRTIRYRLEAIYDYLGIEDPNPESGEDENEGVAA